MLKKYLIFFVIKIESLHPLVETSNIIEDVANLLQQSDESFSHNILLLIQNIINLGLCDILQGLLYRNLPYYYYSPDSTHNYLIRRKGLKFIIESVIRHEESERICEAAALIFSCLSFIEEFTIPMGQMNIFPALSIIMRKKNENIYLYTCRTLTNLACDC